MKDADPEFDNARTTTLLIENKNTAFVCTKQGLTLQTYFNVFRHVFCQEEDDSWMTCGFFEEDTGVYNHAECTAREWPTT